MKILIQPVVTKKATNTVLLARRDELNTIMEESKILLDSINDELMTRVRASDEGLIVINDRTVKIVERISFASVPLEFAKKFRAVKKVVDGDVLKPLYKNGVKMPDVKISEYLYVR